MESVETIFFSCYMHGNHSGGGIAAAKTGVQLVYKPVFAAFFASNRHPMLLGRLCGQKDAPSELSVTMYV